MYLADYEFGEEIILLDYVIGSAADFTTLMISPQTIQQLRLKMALIH